jgi:hypothetical protein
MLVQLEHIRLKNLTDRSSFFTVSLQKYQARPILGRASGPSRAANSSKFGPVRAGRTSPMESSKAATPFMTNTDYLNDRHTSALRPATAACAHAIENSAVRPALEPHFSALVVDSISLGPFGLTWLILVECVF